MSNDLATEFHRTSVSIKPPEGVLRALDEPSTQTLDIGFLVRKNWYPPTAGSSVHVHQIASQLMARGHRLHTLVADCKAPGVQSYGTSQLASFLRRVDLLYIRIFGAWQLGKYSLLKLLKWHRCPVVWEVNAPLEEHRLTGFSERQVQRMYREIRLLAKFVDAAICITEPLAKYVAEEWGVKRCHVVASGSDPELFSPKKRQVDAFPKSAGKFHVIWGGSPQYAWQGADFLIQVASRMLAVDPDVRFVVAGREEVFRELQPPGNMIFLGPQSYFDMPRWFASADIGFCPCLDVDLGIGFYRAPLKLFDYMASGIPSVITRTTETEKIIKSGINGWLIENRVDEVIDAILAIKKSPALGKELGNQARRDVENKYNWQRAALETEHIMASLRGRT